MSKLYLVLFICEIYTINLEVSLIYFRSAGKAQVSVSFSCDFVSASFSESKSYSSSVLVSVIPDPPLALGVPITWILPPQYITSSLLPSSFESFGQWDSRSGKGTFTYSLLRNYGELNEIALSKTISIQDNRIKTAESNEVACIQVKDHLTGRIEIASCIRVSEVAILLSLIPCLEFLQRIIS